MSTRREVLKKMATLAAVPVFTGRNSKPESEKTEMNIGQHINHSACRWCYNDIPLEVLCQEGKKFGLQSVELIGPRDWPVVKKYGLTCAMANGADMGIAKGWNNPVYHDQLVKNYEEIIPLAKKEGLKNVICLSGNREGIDNETGLSNCVNGIKRVLALAEKNNINLVMELLNSKVDHKDYHCDHTAWGVELCKRIGSENFLLLYDIYHMQIMEGDVIRTIRENKQYIAHYHTGGVPGRHEIDETQELNYPSIMKAIVETGFTGFVSQEFVPTAPDKLSSLKKCIEICDV
ncbi:MAG TPA: TIM barrel protein [Cyclobacteriaceae bacterium]|nr:TIM barrel protein [Cyclobacteriaceae bacterium]